MGAALARIAGEELELRPLLQRVSDAIAVELGCEFVAIVRIDREPARFVCEALTSGLPTSVHVGYGRELGSGVVGKVALSGRPLRLDEVTDDPDYIETLPGARSELCVPIVHRDEVVAAVNLESPRPGAFRELEPVLVEVVEPLARAIAGARLLEATRQRAFQLELLSELSRRAFEVEDLGERLDGLAALLRERLDLRLVAILVSDESLRYWRHRAIATVGPSRAPSRTHWPVDAGVVGRAMRRDEPQLVLDAGADPDYFAVDEQAACEYAVPLRLRGGLRGVLNVEGTDRAQLASENLALLRAVAEQLTGPIELGIAHRRLRVANRRLARLSRLDPITGIANRRRFDQALEEEWRRAVRARSPLALALLDLDHFKAYNDSEGHLAGDRCLREVAVLLRGRAQRSGDLAARYGGEEFALLLPGLDAERAAAFVEGVRLELERAALPHPGSPLGVVTTSCGVAAVVPDAAGQPAELVARADAALYRAKRRGRNRVERGDQPEP